MATVGRRIAEHEEAGGGGRQGGGWRGSWHRI